MPYLMRTVGGPFPGDRMHPGPWPLPDVLGDPELRGEYRKVAESQLTEDHPGVLRGAQYEWYPTDDPTERIGVYTSEPAG